MPGSILGSPGIAMSTFNLGTHCPSPRHLNKQSTVFYSVWIVPICIHLLLPPLPMSYLTCLQQNPCSVLSLIPGSLVLNSFSLMRGDCFVGKGVQFPFLSDGWFHLFSFKSCLFFLFLSLKYVFMISVKNLCPVVISNSWGQRFWNIIFSVLIFEDTWFKWWTL